MLIATGVGALPGESTSGVEYARIGDDLPRLMAELHERGVRSVLCEGGPTLNSFLFAAGLVDELFLTMNPKVVGGAAALTIVAGRELVEPRELDLVSVAEADGELYTRWRVRRKCRNACTCRGSGGRCPLVIRRPWQPPGQSALRRGAPRAAGHSRSSRSRM